MPAAEPTTYVHPVVLELEAALVTDSLRTLCRVLAGAAGTITPAVDSYDQTRRPIMDASLTIRSLLRFIELRHGSSDDLSPADFAGRCGSGLKVLLRRCRINLKEVVSAFDTRLDDVYRMIRAFYDQAEILRKFYTFFRLILERAVPAMLQRRSEPLPKLISFLEPYGDVQLTLLHEASVEGVLFLRVGEFDPASQLLSVVEDWFKKARAGQLSIIVANKVRALVRNVACFDIVRDSPQRWNWAVAALWASIPAMTPEAINLEANMCGVLQRGDPGEIFGFALKCVTAGIQSRELFILLGRAMSDAFCASGYARAKEVLGHIDFRGSGALPASFVACLVAVARDVAAKADPEQVEDVLRRWARMAFGEHPCAVPMAAVLNGRELVEAQFGHAARSGALLAELGAADGMLQPLFLRLMQEEVPEPEDLRAEEPCQTSFASRLALLGRLWAAPGADPMRISEADAALRLVGPAREPRRAADVAGDALAVRIAEQLPVRLRDELGNAIIQWRTAACQTALTAVAAPFLLRAVQEGESELVDASSGDLSRSVALLSRSARGDVLRLRDAEWAMSPFRSAAPEDVSAAAAMAAPGAARGGAPEEVVQVALRLWANNGAVPSMLGVVVVQAALAAWEDNGVRGRGLEQLRATHAWLAQEVQPTPASQVSLTRVGVHAALQDISTLLALINGQVASLADLNRARDGALVNLGLTGEAALADAVALAWSAAIPGLPLNTAASHFDRWWKRLTGVRSMVERAVDDVIADLRWKTQTRMMATWAGGSPPGGFAPAWRMEGRSKVPWFVPESVVNEALGPASPGGAQDQGDGLLPRRNPVADAGKFLEAPDVVDKAKVATDGRCIYCGSNHNLQAILVWPMELGGQRLESNLAACCPVCQDFSKRLGPRRWGEVLAAEPMDAARAWWEAQRKANIQYASLLQ